MGEEWSNSVSVLCANLIPIFWCVSSAFVYKLIYTHAMCVFECVFVRGLFRIRKPWLTGQPDVCYPSVPFSLFLFLLSYISTQSVQKWGWRTECVYNKENTLLMCMSCPWTLKYRFSLKPHWTFVSNHTHKYIERRYGRRKEWKEGRGRSRLFWQESWLNRLCVCVCVRASYP